MGVFRNGVIRRMFGLDRSEITVWWRKLHIEELHNLYFSPNFVKSVKRIRLTWAGIRLETHEKFMNNFTQKT